ncbi:PH domain-containing protein [Streptomyces sp. TR06-5]|uniref:PH domain-containing protein n=1 Tax=unclassified Streptomyces TaxID=2593676 RepID=UPI0039A193A5
MTSQTPQAPPVSDRCYRSPAAMAAGVALLAIAVWLGADALLRGTGHQMLVAATGLLLGAPLVYAYTLRPAVFAGRERLRIRNPFRTVTASWTSVDSIRSGYTSEAVVDGKTYQLWSIPVSLRARKAAIRHNARVQAGGKPGRGMFGVGLSQSVTGEEHEKQATSDTVIHELREMAEKHGADGTAPAPGAPVAVRWAYEVIAPAAAGAAGLLALLLT